MGLAEKLVFSDEATLHVCGKVNRHNVRIWGMENPHATMEHIRDLPKVNFLLQILQTIFLCRAIYYWYQLPGHAATVAKPQLQEDSEDFLFQQAEALPHFHFDVRAHLSANLPSHWIGH